MSENNHAALALFAECDSLLQNLSVTDESALLGGCGASDTYKEHTYKESCRRRRTKNRREKRHDRREKRREKMC